VSNDNVFKLIQPGTFDDQLTEILRQGARALLAQAVGAEVVDFLAKHADLMTENGRQRIVRHGHLPEREIISGIGPVTVRPDFPYLGPDIPAVFIDLPWCPAPLCRAPVINALGHHRYGVIPPKTACLLATQERSEWNSHRHGSLCILTAVPQWNFTAPSAQAITAAGNRTSMRSPELSIGKGDRRWWRH
jgi:hypothetical protein